MNEPPEALAVRTFVFGELLIPIGVLLTDLNKLPGKLGGNEVQVSPHEHGVGGAMFLMLGAVIEGSLHRFLLNRGEGTDRRVVEYFHGQIASELESDRWPRERIETLLTGIEEVLTVRNAVAHSHVWEGEIDTSEMRWVTGPTLRIDEFGDRRHVRVTEGGLSTRLLAMNVIPTKVGRTDVAKALEVIDELWALLANGDSSGMFNTLRNHIPVRFNGSTHRFSQLSRELASAWASESPR